MADSQNNLSLVLNQQDSSGVNILNRLIGAVQYAGSVGHFFNGNLANTNSLTLAMPTTNVLQFYFKNLDTVAVITITGTPQGGASAVLGKIEPGGTFVYWSPATSATAGYTALSIQSDVSDADYELFMGG